MSKLVRHSSRFIPYLWLLVLLATEVPVQSQRSNDTPVARNATAAMGQSNPSMPHAMPLRFFRAIPLPGVEKRIDHLGADPAGQQLFVAALGNNTLEVIDLKAGKRVRSIAGLQEPQGIAFAPELNRIFVANGGSGECDVYDARTVLKLQSIQLGGDADNVRYEAATERVYVGFGNGALAFLDARSGRRLGEVELAGHPESFQLERSGSRIFVNVPAAGHIAVIDRHKQSVLATWPLVGAQSNFPLALDETGHRLFAGCRKPAQVLIYDTSTGKRIDTLVIGEDTDDLFWDALRKRLYVICGAGVVSCFQEQDNGGFHLVAEIQTAPGARTGLFVSDLGRLFVAVPHRGVQLAEIREFAVTP